MGTDPASDRMGVCRYLIVGVGRDAAGDDAVGLAVIRRLQGMALPPHVSLAHVAEPSALVDRIEGAGKVVLVDAVVNAGAAGTVVRLTPADLEERALSSLSSHGMSVAQAVAMARALGRAPDVAVVAVCVEPPRRYHVGLSEEAMRAVPKAARMVLETIGIAEPTRETHG